MKLFLTRLLSGAGFKSFSRLRKAVIRTTCLALSLSVVSTGSGLLPAQATSTYNGTNGVVDCGTSGTFTITDNVVTAQSGCVGNVVIPEGVTNVAVWVFYNARVTSFVVSSSSVYLKVQDELLLTKDGKEVVLYPHVPTNTAVLIPQGVEQIRPAAFYETSITSISLPQSLSSISSEAFRGAPLAAFTVAAGNTTFNAIDGVLFSGTTLLDYPPAKVNENGLYSIPESTTALANYSFQGANSIVTLELPASLTSIENGAFDGLSTTSSSLQSVTVHSSNNNYTSSNGVLFNKLGTTLVKYPVKKSGATYVIPAQTTEIGYAAFSYARDLTSVTLPSSLKVIGYDGFARTSFTSIDLPSGLTTIANYAFVENFLTSVTIPSSVTSIGDGAFLTNSITTVNFSGNAPTIGSGIFDGNTVSIIENTVGSLCWGATFAGTAVRHVSPPRTCSTYNGTQGVVDCGTFGTFTITGNIVVSDNGCAGSIAIPEGVSSVGDDVFVDNQLLTSVTIPSSVTSFGAYSFSGASSLLSFTVHSSNNDFSSSNGILFNKSGTTLVRYPATKGSTYTIPETVTSIGNYAFQKTQMTNVTLSSGVTNIGAFAFRDNSLTSVTIPSSVTNIGAWAFGLNLLTTVTIPSSVASVGNYAFYGNDLTSVTIQNGVADIGIGVFFDNELTSVTIPSSVTNIGDYAFSDNVLTSVSFLGNAPPDQANIFGNNPNLTGIDAGISSTGWGSTFSGLPVRVSVVQTPAPAPAPAPTPDVSPAPAPAPTPAPVPAPVAATTPTLTVVGTPVAITRTPSAAIAASTAIGVNKTKVMVALTVPTATKAANQVTKYVITLKTSKGVTITRTISVKPGRSVSPTLTGKKKTTYTMTVTAITKSGKKTSWKGPRVKTS